MFWDHELKAVLGEERAHQLPPIRASEGHTPSLPSLESKLPPSAGKAPRKESVCRGGFPNLGPARVGWNHSDREASEASPQTDESCRIPRT